MNSYQVVKDVMLGDSISKQILEQLLCCKEKEDIERDKLHTKLRNECNNRYWIVNYTYPIIKEDRVTLSYIGFSDKNFCSVEDVIRIMNWQVETLGGKYSVTEYYKED